MGYDAIIIGAGSVGVPTAFSLAKQGFKVLVLENKPSAGQGQNKAAIGGVRATHSDPTKILLCQKSLKIMSTWEEKYGRDVGWKNGGYCFPVYEDREEHILKKILPIQKKFELNIDWKERDAILDACPGINPNGLRGGTLSPGDGQISPLLFIEAVEEEARNLGVEFMYRTSVTGLILEGNRIKGVKTDKGEYLADVVINAAGVYAQEISAMAGIDIPIIPDSHEAGITAPVKPFLDPLIVDIRPGSLGKMQNFYFGQGHTGAIIFCYTPKPPIQGTDRRSTSEFMPILSKRLVDLIPRFKNLTIRRVWRGLYPMTPDGLAIVGAHPKVEGLYFGAGMCGQGFMLGPGVGDELASLIKTGKTLIDQDVFDILSPTRDFHATKTELLK